MGAREIEQFLNHLAVQKNQALSALVFLYREVLKKDFDWSGQSGTGKEAWALARRADRKRFAKSPIGPKAVPTRRDESHIPESLTEANLLLARSPAFLPCTRFGLQFTSGGFLLSQFQVMVGH